MKTIEPERMVNLRRQCEKLAGELADRLADLKTASTHDAAREAAEDAACWLQVLQRCLKDVY